METTRLIKAEQNAGSKAKQGRAKESKVERRSNAKESKVLQSNAEQCKVK